VNGDGGGINACCAFPDPAMTSPSSVSHDEVTEDIRSELTNITLHMFPQRDW